MIALTNEDNDRVLVNPEHIVSVTTYRGTYASSIVSLVTGNVIYARENIDTVLSLIGGGEAEANSS